MFGRTKSRKERDGGELFRVRGKTWTRQYSELWEQLVPTSGKAETVQGEALRLVGRLSREVLDNGSVNWDDDFLMMRDKLAEILSSGRPAGFDAVRAAGSVSPYTDEETFSSVAKAVVEWILANPEPVKLGEVLYKR